MSGARLLQAGRLCVLGLRAHVRPSAITDVAAALQGASDVLGTPLWQRSFSVTPAFGSQEHQVSIMTAAIRPPALGWQCSGAAGSWRQAGQRATAAGTLLQSFFRTFEFAFTMVCRQYLVHMTTIRRSSSTRSSMQGAEPTMPELGAAAAASRARCPRSTSPMRGISRWNTSVEFSGP